MKKLIAAFLLLLALCIQNAAAKPVKEDEAKQFAKNWAREKWGRKIDSISTKEKAKSYVQQISSEENLYYVLSFPQGGWIIISGDDVAYPVIAFSPTGTYSAQNHPIQFEDWMENVKKEISTAIKAKHAPLPKAAAAWKKFNVSAEEFAAKSFSAPAEESLAEATVGPLLSTTWSQGKYYNQYCPLDESGPDGHALTGCGATAMAQIMKYHNHPANGSGSHSYSHPTYGTLSADFGTTTYNWSSMPDTLSSYNSYVATLLYHIGVSVDMDYSPYASGASMGDIVYALKTYFNYRESLYFAWAFDYSSDEWTTMLRTEIDNRRPVLYSGEGEAGGHGFVCDGYSDSDYFHFNWGWSGHYDGYFYLNALTPGSSDYSYSQAAIIGIEPVVSSGPDMTVTNPSASKTSLTLGESLTFLATAKNGGAASSAATTLRWYRSTDATITTADTQLGSQAVGALSAGQSAAHSATLTAPSAAGTYWLGACIDAVSGETNTGNNCSSGVQITVTAPPAAPDLSVINPSASKTSLAPSESLTFSATAKNGGTASSAATTLRWYRSADATISTADTQLGSQAVGALSAGQTSALSATLTAPSAAGTYWLGACIDAVSGETNTGNNCSSGVQITVTAPPAAPDLSVTNPSASKTSLAPGESLTFSATAKNGGTASSAATTLRWYRSADSTISTADTQLGSQAVAALSAGQTSSQSATLTAPSAAGTYWLGACIDAVSGETNTGNNCSSGVQVTVTAGKPDLIVSSLNFPSQFDAGNSGSATAGFYNQGTAASVATTATCYYINKATQAVSGAVCQMQVPALAVNQTASRTAPLTAPCSEGAYQLKVCVNSGANVESNTGNNCMYGDLSVVGNCPKKAFLPAIEMLLKSK